MNIKKNECNDDNGFFIGQHDDDGGDQQDCWQHWSATNLPWNKCGRYLDFDKILPSLFHILSYFVPGVQDDPLHPDHNKVWRTLQLHWGGCWPYGQYGLQHHQVCIIYCVAQSRMSYTTIKCLYSVESSSDIFFHFGPQQWQWLILENRLGVLWAGLEPTRGEYNTTYMAQVPEWWLVTTTSGIQIHIAHHI